MKFRCKILALFLCGQAMIHTACHRVVVDGSPAKTQLQSGNKIFVKLIAPLSTEEETQKLMPPITGSLRNRGLTVTSSVENLATTDEWRQRSVARLQSFAPDYILEIKQKEADTDDSLQVQTSARRGKYDVRLSEPKTGNIVWSATISSRKNYLGFYWNKFAKKLENSMIKYGLLPM